MEKEGLGYFFKKFIEVLEYADVIADIWTAEGIPLSLLILLVIGNIE